jgi:hypothetical protein
MSDTGATSDIDGGQQVVAPAELCRSTTGCV